MHKVADRSKHFGPLVISEQRGWWVTGRLARSGSFVELSFELHTYRNLCFGNTPICYMLIVRDSCLFEFELGRVITRPDPSIMQELEELLTVLASHRPIFHTEPRRVDPALPNTEEPQDRRPGNRPNRGLGRRSAGKRALGRRFMSPTPR